MCEREMGRREREREGGTVKRIEWSKVNLMP